LDQNLDDIEDTERQLHVPDGQNEQFISSNVGMQKARTEDEKKRKGPKVRQIKKPYAPPRSILSSTAASLL